MKLIVIGLGQCGGRIADEFARLNKRAHGARGLRIITGAYAVNTDIADLSGLTTINSTSERILIGSKKTQGHGVGKINELGAEIAHEDADKIIEAIRNTELLRRNGCLPAYRQRWRRHRLRRDICHHAADKRTLYRKTGL